MMFDIVKISFKKSTQNYFAFAFINLDKKKSMNVYE